MSFYKNVIDSLIKYEEISNKKAEDEFAMVILAGEGKRVDMRENLIKLSD